MSSPPKNVTNAQLNVEVALAKAGLLAHEKQCAERMDDIRGKFVLIDQRAERLENRFEERFDRLIRAAWGVAVALLGFLAVYAFNTATAPAQAHTTAAIEAR